MRYSGEHCIGQHILLCAGKVRALGAEPLIAGLDEVGRPACDRRSVFAEDLLLQCTVDGAGRLAVFSADISAHLLRDHPIAFTRKNVCAGLSTAHLAERCAERGIAQIGTNMNDLLKHLVKAVNGIHLCELRFQI